jgi:hypothetical protein
MNPKPEQLPARVTLSPVRAAFWILLTAISLTAFLTTARDSIQSPGTDLRGRIVAARTLLLGQDPYFTPAKTNQIPTLQDPDRYAADCTRCTNTPALLFLYMPLSNLPYQTQRYLWFLLEWTALAVSIALLRTILPTRPIKDLFTSIAILFFAASIFWRLHLERGQYYVFILFLLSLTARLCLGKTLPNQPPRAIDRWWNGIPLGIAAALRITPLAALPPLYAAGYRRTSLGAAAVFLATIVATFPIAGPQTWQSYIRSISIQSRLIVDRDFSRAQHAKLPPLPATAEGVTFKRWLEIPNADLNFSMDVLRLLSNRYPWMPGKDYWSLMSRVASVVVCLIFTVALWRTKLAPEEKLAAAFLCVLSVDFFLPMRISYADVLFLAPLALLIPAMLRRKTGILWLPTTLAALALCNGFFPANFPFSALRPLLLMTALLEYLAFRRAYGPSSSPAEHSQLTQFDAQPA